MVDAVEAGLGYGIFDADNHCYNQSDAFTRYLDPKFAHQAVSEVLDPDTDRVSFYLGKDKITWADSSQGPGGGVRAPGSLKEFLHQLKSGGGDSDYAWEPKRPEYIYRDARLELMDRQGLDGCLLFSELAVSIEHLIEDPTVLHANFHAFNQWLDEEWGYSFEDRLFAPPYISLRDVDQAAAEVEWVLERGAKVVMMSAAPAYGRSPGDRYFDPVWARLNDAGATVAYHVGDSGYNKSVSVLWGQSPQPESYHQSAWQWMNTFCDRPIMDTLSAIIYDNVFGRFPRLKVVAVEFGCEWMPYFIRRLDKMRGMGRNGPWIGGKLDSRPSEIFRRHVLVTPFPEDDVLKVIEEVGPDSLVLGSDYPHAEGLAEPMSYADKLRSLDPATVRLIMRDNGRRLVGAGV